MTEKKSNADGDVHFNRSLVSGSFDKSQSWKAVLLYNSHMFSYMEDA